MKKYIMFLICCIFLTGCWDKVEMEDRSYAITLGIDDINTIEEMKAEKMEILGTEDGQIIVSLGTAEVEKTSGGDKEKEKQKSMILCGRTVSEITKRTNLYSSREMYFGQAKAIVFGENLLKNRAAFMEVLDNLERVQEMNRKIIVLASEGTGSSAVEKIMGTEESGGLYVWDYFKNNFGDTTKLDLEKLLIDLRETGATVIPIINTDEEKIRFGGGVIIKDFEYCGVLNAKEERGLMWAKGQCDSSVLEVDIDNIPIAVSISECKSDISFSQRGNKTICQMEINGVGTVDGYKIMKGNILDKGMLNILEKGCESIITNEVQGAWEISQGYGTDIFGITKKLRQEKKHNMGNGEEVFKGIIIEIETDIKIKGTGDID